MAGGKALNVRMNFQVDTTQAQQQLKGLYSQLNQITSAAGFGKNSQLGITQEIMQATKAAAQLKTAISEAVNPLTGNLNLSKFNDQLIKNNMTLAQYREQLSTLGTAGNQAFNTLARSILTAETPMLRLGKAAQTMWTVLGNTIRWQATSSMLHGIMTTASNAMGYVKSLDSSLNHIRIVTGQSTEQMTQFAKTANQAAKELNTSTNEYAKASLIYYQQGLSNKQVEERTRTTIKLANVAGQSAKTVSDQMTAVWNNFYDGSKSLEYYADVITALGASTASSSEEIAKGLQKFSSIAQTTGLSYEYATSALSTVVAATRQSADSVGTSFKTLFSRLQGLSLGETLDDGTTLNKYSKALDVVGVNIKKANGDLKDMDTILNEIGNKWEKLNQDQKIALAQTVGGVRNYTGLMSLMDHWDDFQVNLKTAQEAQGTLQNQADIYAESWAAASAHVKAASEQIYSNLLDDKFFKGLTNGFGTVLEVVGALTDSLGGMKGTMLTVANGALQFFRPQLTEGFENLGLSLRSMTKAGRAEVLDLRKQAVEALNNEIRFSQYDSVNNLIKSQSTQYTASAMAYEDALKKGAITERMVPGYQTLFNAVAAQEQKAISAAEQMAELNRITSDTSIKQRQQANLNFQNRQSELQSRFLDSKDGFSGSVQGRYGYWMQQARQGSTVAQMQLNNLLATNPGLAAQYEVAFTRGAFQQQLGTHIENYSAAKMAESVLSELRTTFEKPITAENAQAAAEQIKALSGASKTLGIDLTKTIPSLGALNNQILDLEKKGANTAENLANLFTGPESAGLKLGQLVDEYQAAAHTGGVSSAEMETKLSNFLGETLGITDEVLARRVAEIVGNADTDTAGKMAALKETALSETQQKQLYGLITGEKVTGQIGLAASLTTNLNLMAALGQTISSVSNASKILNDENSTTVQQIGALSAVAMSAGMAMKPLGSFIDHFNDKLTIMNKQLPISNGLVGLLSTVAVAAGLAIRSGIKEWEQSYKIENIVKSYSESIATATQRTSDAQVAYEQLITQKDTHNKLLDDLYEMRQGTLEFTQSLLAANNSAQELIENYDLIYGEDYTYGKYGEAIFDQRALETKIQEKKQEYLDAQLDTSNLKYIQSLERLYMENQEVPELNRELSPGFIGSRTISTLLNGFLNQEPTAQTKPTNSFIEYLSRITDGSTTEEYEQIISTLRKILPGSTDEEISSKLEQLAKEVPQFGVGPNQIFSEKELINVQKVLFGENAPYILQAKSAAQGIIQNELTRNQQLTSGQRDMAAMRAEDVYGPDTMQLLGEFAHQAGTAGWWEKHFTDHDAREYYYALFGKHAGEDVTDEQVKEAVESKIVNLAYTDIQQLSLVLEQMGQSLESLGLESLTTDLTTIVGELDGLNIPDITNLTFDQIEDIFGKLKEGKDQSTVDVISKYEAQATQLFTNQFADLQEALLLSFTDSAIESAQQGIVDQYSSTIQVAAANIAEGLTYGNLKQAISAMTNANTVGTETGQAMRAILKDNKNRLGGFNADALAVMRNYNYDNSISGLYANNQLAKWAQNARQRDMYQNLLASQIKDMQEEKGFFMALYNSSGFADVIASLNEQFQKTGQITAQNVHDLASKSEVLSQALKFSAENADKLKVNAGGLAGILNAINKGTISADRVSSGLVSAMSTAKSADAANAAAFTVVDNQDLGRSASDLLQYFQNPGKEYYNVRKQGWGFYSEPIQNIVKMFGGSDVKNAYAAANQKTNLKTSELFNQLPSYFTDFLYSMAGVSGKGKSRKAKGGGGPEDVWGFVYDTLNANKNALSEAGFGKFGSNEFWNNLGFDVDSKGNFFLRGIEDGSQDYTIDQLKEKLQSAFEAIGWDSEAAKDFVDVAYGLVKNSGQTGARLDKNAAKQAYDNLVKEETPQTEEQLRAFFNENAAFLPYGTGDEGFKKFLAAYRKDGGNVGYSKKEKEEWNITTAEDLVTKAKEAGTNYNKVTNLGTPPGAPTQYRDDGTTKVEDIKGLGTAYGAYDQKTGSWDYNKLVDMITSMGGTEADLITLMENSRDAFEGAIYGKDRYGHTVEMGTDTVKQFSERINALTGTEIVANRVEQYGGNTEAAAYWRNPVTGELVIDADGEEEAKYNRTVLSGLSKKDDNVENIKNGNYSFLTNEEMNATITSVGEKLRQKQANGEELTLGEQQYLDYYGDGTNRDAKTNQLLTQILYNTDTVVDQNGELVDLTEMSAEEQEAIKGKKAVNEEGEVVDENGEVVTPPSEEPKPASDGASGWGGQGGGGWGKWQVFGVDSDGNPIVGRVNPSTGDTQIKGQEQQGGDSGSGSSAASTGSGKASGQNNHLLHFATGAEGHIAVTGELGPELRIKEDGSADLLGKKGREYTWVEPTDRIYTATQTASILGRNNIPSLEGLAKGISNYIPGYRTGADWNNSGSSSSSKGGGGSGGGEDKKDPRYDPNTLKIRDVLERYYTILQKIEDITRMVEKFAQVAERAWGKDRIKAIEKQTDLYKQQYNAQKQYVNEIKEYLNTDESALTTMIKEFVDDYNEGKEDKDKLSWAGAQFDSNGVLTNYRDFVEKLVEKYNKNAEENARDKEAQYKFQEQLKDIQFYTETLNLYESETDKLLQLANQIIDSALKEITYRVEYEMEINGDLAKLLNFKADLVKDNIYQAAKYVELLGDQIENITQDLNTLQDGLYDYLGQLAGENMRRGKEYNYIDLGLSTKNPDAVDIAYDDIDFEKVSKNLDTWINELRKNYSKAAEEIDAIIIRSEDGLISNYEQVFKKLNEMNVRLNDSAIQLLHEDVGEFFKQLSNLKDNPTWDGLSTEMKDYLTSTVDQMMSKITEIRSKYGDIIDELGDKLKEFNKELTNEVNEFDYYKDLYKSMEDILNLTNRHMTDVTSDFFKALNSKVFDNNINKIKATNNQYKLLQQTYAQVKEQYDAMVLQLQAATNEEERVFWQEQVDNLKDQLDIANTAMEDAAKNFQQAWQEALEGAKTAYQTAVKEASRTFEESFSPFFNTLALLEAQFSREKQLADLYVDDYQRIHDLSRLNRDIQNSIMDTDNIKSKERLRELQKEINDLQDSGVELSEYDLDILDKKYKLELARQALEDARDAKSLVRLSRDNNGNWGYIYTSNEDEVAEAEQNYEDAIREMEQANEDYIDNIQDQIISVQKEAQEAIANLSPDDFATYDEYLAAVQNITDAMMQNMNYLRQQLNNAFGNNEYLHPFIVDKYGINDHNLTDDFQDTILSGILGVNDMDQVVQDALNRINDLAQASSEAFVTLQENQEQIYEAAEHNINLIGAQMGAETEVIADASAHQVQVVEDLSERIADAFTETANQVGKELENWAGQVYQLTNDYADLMDVILELKRLDGEYVEPTKFSTTDEAIDSWKEISDFKQALAANGQVAYIRTNEDMKEEFVDTFTAGTTAATNYIKGAMEAAAKKEAIDVGDKLDTQDEYDKVIAYLEKRGVVVVKEGDEYHTVWSKDDEWLKKRKKAIDDAKKAAAGGWYPSDIPYGWFLGPNGFYKPGLSGYYDLSYGLAGCFAPDTQILMADGTTKDIQLVEIGDYVISYNEETNEFIPKQVLESYPHYQTPKMVKLTFNNGIILELTPGHPICSTNGWKSLDILNSFYEHETIASLLNINDTIIGIDNNAILINIEYLTIGNEYISYNIEIEDCHTFIANGLVAHNSRKKQLASGGYTGEWANGSNENNGRWALLHQKELVLNAHDTENFLNAMEIVRQLDNLTNWMSNGLGDLLIPTVKGENGELEQNVHIDASFPNVTDHNEIEMAFDNLVNRASQYANRK